MTTSEIDDENRIEKQFMSSQTFHRTPGGCVQEITVREQFKPRILESFNPATQELFQHHPATIHTQRKIQPAAESEQQTCCKSRAEKTASLMHRRTQTRSAATEARQCCTLASWEQFVGNKSVNKSVPWAKTKCSASCSWPEAGRKTEPRIRLPHAHLRARHGTYRLQGSG
jgi:hypothetical protein